MKAIIPVAGAGTNLRPLTYTQPKALIPIAGKPILAVIIDQLQAAGVQDFVFVVGYLGDKIIDFIEKHYPKLKYKVIHQHQRKGTAHAIFLTREVVTNNEDILIVFGDTIADYNLSQILSREHSQVGVRKVDDPRNFGVAEINDHHQVLHFVEKPRIPKSNLALVGIYFIKNSNSLYDALNHILKQKNDIEEFHLTTALEEMRLRGAAFEAFRVNSWYDCGQKQNVLDTNALLLKQENELNPQPSAIYEGTSVIIPPVSIAEGCSLVHSIIGPNVTIGENSTIHSSIIKDSIIGSFTKLEEVMLNNSIIGSDAYIRGNSQSLNIGDNTEIDFG